MTFWNRVIKFFEQIAKHRVERELAMHNMTFKLDK